MFEEQRKRSCFQIGEGFLFIKLLRNSIYLQYCSTQHLQDVFGAAFSGTMPKDLEDIFSSPSSMFQYLTSQPERIVTLSEEKMEVAISRGQKHSIFKVDFEKISQNSTSNLCKRRNAILSKQIEISRASLRAGLKEFNKVNEEMFSIYLEAQQKYHSVLINLQLLKSKAKEKRSAKSRAKTRIRQKKDLLMKLKEREGLCITLDD